MPKSLPPEERSEKCCEPELKSRPNPASASCTEPPAVPCAIRTSCSRPAGVAGQKTSLFEGAPHLAVVLDQRPRDPETQRVGLAVDSATFKLGIDVETSLGRGELEGFHHPHPGGHGGEVVLELATIEDEPTRALPEADPSDGLLAAADCLGKRFRHQTSTFLDLSA